MGAIGTVRNFLSGVAAHEGPRAKRRRLKRRLSRSRVPDGGLSGKGQFAKLQQEGDTRYVHKAALETLGRLQEPVLEETERALQKAIRLYPQNAEAHYILGVLLKERGRLEEAGIENILPTESFKYFLGNIHWLDALTPPLKKHLQEVATKVKAMLSTESARPPKASQPSLQAKAPTIQQPPRRNLLSVIGGIVAVLIATSVLLFFWRSSVSPVSEPCSKRPGYPLGHWEVGTQGASAATYSTFITFTTSTSGTWFPSSGKGSFEASVAPAPGKAVVITLRVEGGTYESENQLVVSADGCSMTGTFVDSEGHRGEAIYRWQGVR